MKTSKFTEQNLLLAVLIILGKKRESPNMVSGEYPKADFFRGSLLEWTRETSIKYAKNHNQDVAQAICEEVRRKLFKSTEVKFSKDCVRHEIISMSRKVFLKEEFWDNPQLAAWVLHVAHHYNSVEADAEDLRQDAYMKLKKSSQRAVQKAFVGSIIRTCFFDAAKIRKEEKQAIQDILAKELVAPSRKVDYSAEYIVLEEIIAKSLLRLKPIYKEVLDLRFLKGHNIATTASVLGISPSNVKQRTLRAVRELRRLLEPYWRETDR